jgi:hypothetical protein
MYVCMYICMYVQYCFMYMRYAAAASCVPSRERNFGVILLNVCMYVCTYVYVCMCVYSVGHWSKLWSRDRGMRLLRDASPQEERNFGVILLYVCIYVCVCVYM